MLNPKLDLRSPKQIQDSKRLMSQRGVPRVASGFGFGTWRLIILLGGLGAANLASAATLSDSAVDSYNTRVGTETFSGLYKFTASTLLVETAKAITNIGTDTITLYMSHNTSGHCRVSLG